MAKKINTAARFARRCTLALILSGLAGCATAPAPVEQSPVFFPAGPELPRIQYLASYTGRSDIEEKQSGFDRFVVGERPDVKVDKPYGVAMWDGKIYVCDTNSTVAVFDLAKKSFGLLKGATGPGALRQPINISIDREGTKYVTDPVRAQIVVFDRNDEYVKAIGMVGSWRPVDAVPFGEQLYVADHANGVVRVFDLASGELLRTIGDKGDPAERIDRPTNLAFDSEGYLYVTDLGRFQVVKFDRDGHFQAMFGRIGDTPGFFARPKGIAVDREGRLLAVDAAYNNVQVFDRTGRLLLFFGEAGTKPGNFDLPAKVAIDYDNVKYFQPLAAPNFRIEYLLLVTSQFGPRRVNVFGYGRDTTRTYPSDEELRKKVEERRQEALRKEAAAGGDKPKPPDAEEPKKP